MSYNTEERESVIQIARYLRDKAKLRPWFDQWHAIPGISVSENLKLGLETSETCAVFIGRSGEGPWQKSEIRKAIERQKQKSILRVIPVLLPDAPDELDTSLFLLEYTWVDFRGKCLNDDETLWRLECGIRGVVPGSRRPETPEDAQINQPQNQAGAHKRQAMPAIPPTATPEKRIPRWQLLGMLLLIITVVIGGWIILPKLIPVRPIQKNTPTPTIAPTQKAVAIPTKQPEPTPSPASTSTPLSVTSCWENETRGATCTEDTTGMEFVYVPGGEFWMGCGEKEEGCDDDEKPRHQVRVKGFWIGKYEVTQAQWETVMKNNPSCFKGADRPVETVSWNDVQEFLKKLNATVETRGRASLQFRLPSEAEWEYAACAGTITPFSFGETISTDQANYDGNYTYGNGKTGVYRRQTTDVGSFPPNGFGLYDMHGNVWEWVADTYHENYNGAPDDGSIWGNLGDKKANRLLRGGSWRDRPNSVRSAYRGRVGPDLQGSNIGFRVVVVR